MGIDSGKGQIDIKLMEALTDVGVAEHDARELASMNAFGGSLIKPWLAGLRAAATLLNNQGSINLDTGTLLSPWDSICGALISTNGIGPGEALAKVIQPFSTEIQAALIATIGAIAQQQANQASKPRHSGLTSKPNPTQTQGAQQAATYLRPIDPDLVRQIQKLLATGKQPTSKKLKQAGEILIEWLAANGKFIKTVYGVKYYLYRPTHRLFTLNTDTWHGWLYLLTGVNPASNHFRYLTADCETAAEDGEQLDVVRVAHWDPEQQMLRVSRFDGYVYRLDGHTIELEANGDGPALFDDATYWLPYSPVFDSKGEVLDWTTNQIPNWDGDRNELGLLFKAWWLATFFTEICPTRPILVMKGEKGSGKSMSLRVMLRMLLGPAVDVVGVPEKPDAFVALTSNSHLVVLDNMDDVNKEIRDKIASLSTGKLDQVRKLYTTNESHVIRYRCWLAVTSRTPDTLQRDDLVDRVLILPVCRIDDTNRTRESRFLLEVVNKRNRWWGDVLTALNSIVAVIRRDGLPDRGGFRMEDWAALGTVIARSADQEEIWETGLNGVKTRQAEFLLEDEVVREAIEAWLSSSQYRNTPLDTRTLYEAAKSALFGVDRPDQSWPRSVKSFGRRLAGMRRELQAHLEKSGIEMRWTELGKRTYYTFEKPIP